jgi:hypothetical protein
MDSKYNSQQHTPYKVEALECDGEHRWAVVNCQCDLSDHSDPIIVETVNLIRKSYGENVVIEDAQAFIDDGLLEGTFDFLHLTTAIRMGMPDPEAEGNKPLPLTNYRSQSAEMLVKNVLAQVYNFQYPVAAQETTGNPNQPILGFDGWGIHKDPDSNYTLVLIQVKATDQNKRPPAQALELVDECKDIPKNPSAIARSLTTIAIILRSPDNNLLKSAVMRMLETLGKKQLPNIMVAPAIVRGITTSDIEDLQPIRQAGVHYTPAIGRGLSVSLGVKLEDFGRTVMLKAREVV